MKRAMKIEPRLLSMYLKDFIGVIYPEIVELEGPVSDLQ